MKEEILVIGGGPVGLAGALFVHRANHSVRVVEKLLAPVQQSKALAVNPRTLEILEPTGITEKMLKLGLKIAGASLWRDDGTRLGELDFKGLHSRYPFMLALSQATTERLLAEALNERGVRIERGREVVSCVVKDGEAETGFADGSEISSRYVLAADGAHSAVREHLKIPFEGSSLAGEWFLVDVALKTHLAADQAHVVFHANGGFEFLVRVVEDINQPIVGDPIWRVISSRPEPLKDFKHGTASAKPVWSSRFHVSHRICRRLNSAPIFLAGDAAHIHSPAGARGMNLGIEDAWVFARLLEKGRLQDYEDLRKSVDKSVVRQVDLLSRVVAGDHAYLRVLREFVLPKAIKVAPFRRLMTRALSGLDHSIEI